MLGSDVASGKPQVPGAPASPRSGPAAAPHRRARKVAAVALGAGMLLVPLAAAAVVAVAAPHLVSPPEGIGAVPWWIGVFVGSATAAWGTDHLARRHLPLVGLLRLSLVFPADVGSRLGLALRAGSVRDLEGTVIDLRETEEIDRAEAAATIIAYASALQKHSRFTRGHCERVRAYSELIARELGVPKADRELLRWAALLHDIGKLEVPSDLLDKPGKLDDQEWIQMREHAAAGLRLGEPLRVWLGAWVGAIGEHHERYDGAGYPRGLEGRDISLAARIVAVADSYETMTAARPYKKPMPQRDARAELVAQAGKQFDPVVVRAMLSLSVRRLRWAAGPIAGLGDALVVALITQTGTASAVVGAGSVAGAWGATFSALSPLRVGVAAAAVVAAASVAPGHDPAPARPDPAPRVLTTPMSRVPTAPTYRAAAQNLVVLDPFIPFGNAAALHDHGHGVADRSGGSDAGHGPSAATTASAPSATLPVTAKSPVLAAPATRAIPHVSSARPAAPEVPAKTTPSSVQPDRGNARSNASHDD